MSKFSQRSVGQFDRNLIPAGMLGHITSSSHNLSNAILKSAILKWGRGLTTGMRKSIHFLDTNANIDFDNFLIEEGVEAYVIDFLAKLVLEKLSSGSSSSSRSDFGYISSELREAVAPLFQSSSHTFRDSDITDTTHGEWNKFVDYIANDFPKLMAQAHPGRYPAGTTAFTKHQLLEFICDWSLTDQPATRYDKLVGQLGSTNHGVFTSCEQIPGTGLKAQKPVKFQIHEFNTRVEKPRIEIEQQLLSIYMLTLTISLPKGDNTVITPANTVVPYTLRDRWCNRGLFNIQTNGCEWMNPNTFCQTGDNCALLGLIQLFISSSPPSLPTALFNDWTAVPTTHFEILGGLKLLKFVMSGQMIGDISELVKLSNSSSSSSAFSGPQTMHYYRRIMYLAINRMCFQSGKLFINGGQEAKRYGGLIFMHFPSALATPLSCNSTTSLGFEDSVVSATLRMKNGNFLCPDHNNTNMLLSKDVGVIISSIVYDCVKELTEVYTWMTNYSGQLRPRHLQLDVQAPHLPSDIFQAMTNRTWTAGLTATSFIQPDGRVIGALRFTPQQQQQQVNYKSMTHIFIQMENKATDRLINTTMPHIENICGQGSVTVISLPLPAGWINVLETDPRRIQYENLCVVFAYRFAVRIVHITSTQQNLAISLDRLQHLKSCTEGIGETAYYSLVATIFNQL